MSHNMVLILGMAVVTFIVRYTLFAFAGKFEFSDSVKKFLQYVPPAVLTAIILPAIVMPTGDRIQLSVDNPYLVGGLVTFVFSFFVKNLLVTSAVGMGVFFVCKWLIG